MKKILLKCIYQILSYNKWANQQLIENISKLTDEDYYKESSVPFNNVHGLLFHLFYYDAKLYTKFVNQLDFTIERQLSRNSLSEQILLYSIKWLNWIERLRTMSKLPEFFDEISKNVMDLSIHNNYHRGQINIILSFMGYKPESLDIFVYNENDKLLVP